jgi:hypothetical protein
MEKKSGNIKRSNGNMKNMEENMMNKLGKTGRLMLIKSRPI